MSKENFTNIKHLPSSWKIMGVFKKPRSPLTKMMAMEPKEDWFVEVITYKTKSGEITNHSLITQKDVDHWVEGWKRILGFEKQK